MLEPPSRQEVQRVLLDLLEGGMTREDADVWASQWVVADQLPDIHSSIWEALTLIHGCDLRHGPGGRR